MNRKMVRYIIAQMLGVEGLVMLVPAIVSSIYGEAEAWYFIFVAIILGLIWLIFGRKAPVIRTLHGRDGLAIVGLAWILWSIFGAMPLHLSGCIPNPVDAFFEVVSGFTTTGSTILTDIEALPMGMNFWRCFTHWIGGMGVLMFVMVLTTLEREHAMFLMRAEVPGPEADKLVPKARSTAQILYGMYLAMTAIEVILLWRGGMTPYEALVHSFSTAGTGGFSVKNASIAAYNSAYIDGVITIFMILFGVNFNLYYFLLVRKVKKFFKNEELRVYLGIIAVSTIVIMFNILNMYDALAQAFRYSVFQVASVITTTGFVTADFNQWPEFSKAILLTLMVIGACAGSTGGGVKVSRVVIIWKGLKQEVKRMMHPKSVTVVKMNGSRVSSDTIRGVYIFLAIDVIVLIVSTLLVALDNFDFASSFSGVLTAMNNVGPGISMLGPISNFSPLSGMSKIVLCVDMLLGRLEIFPMLLLLSPSFWRRRF